MPCVNCPICGKQPVLQQVEGYPMQYKFFCGTHVSVGDWYPNTLGAQRSWNRRTIDKKQPDFYKPTNADRIRGMSDAELAVFMRDMMDCVSCHKVMSRSDITCTGNYKECVKRCTDWLRQPAEEGSRGQ